MTVVLLAGVALSPGASPNAVECAPGRDVQQDRGPCVEAAQAVNSDDQRRLIVQKLSLLQAYLRSESVRRARDGGNAEAAALVAAAEAQLAAAQRSLEAGRLQEAGDALDDGLRAASSASSLAGRPPRSAEQEKERYARMDGQIRSYLDATANALKDRDPKVRPDEALARVDRLVADASRLAGAGQYRQANKVLAEAYQLTVALVSGLRKGTTLVSTLRFATPADELEYERRRNGSYEMLVAIMLDEQRGGAPALRQLADRYLAENRDIRRRAERQAAAGDYHAAISSMEEATARLVRVLQAGGLPVPE